jgi:YVTN family beta-propeller protein
VEARVGAIGDRIEARLALGEHAALTADLESLLHDHPLNERFIGQLMLALYRGGRQADSLEVFRRARSGLLDDLGIEPGHELRKLEQGILEHDPGLATPPRQSASGVVIKPRRRWAVASAAVILVAVLVGGIAQLARHGQAKIDVIANSVAAIDPGSGRIVAALPVGNMPGPITFGSGSLWVGNLGDQTISRIDPIAARALRTIALSHAPTSLAASAGEIWTAEPVPDSSTVAVTRIDPQFDDVAATRRLATVVPGGSAVVAARGRAVWVAPSAGLLTRLDAATGQTQLQLDPNSDPTGVAIGDGGLWVTDSEADNVTRIDPGGKRAGIAVGNGPSAVAIGAGGVWVVDSLADEVTRIDAQTNAVTATIHVGRSPSSIAVGARSVWIADSGDGTVERIDPVTNRVTARIVVGGRPQALAIADGRVWVTIDAAPSSLDQTAPNGTLRAEAPGGVDYLDPALAYAPGSWQLLYATCAKLLNYPDRSGVAGEQLAPEVARALPTRANDGRTYTFVIRSGFRFSPPSDQPVTAQTFKYTIERSLSRGMKGPVDDEFTDIIGARAYMAGKAANISGVIVHGDALTIHLIAPAPDIVSLLGQPFFCAVPTDTPVVPGGERIVPMAGPYYVTSYAPGQSVVLRRNPNYDGNRPHRLAQITLTLGVSSQQAVTDIDAGTADYTPVNGPPAAATSALAQRLAARYGADSPAASHGAQQYFADPQTELDFFLLNTHRPLFADARLRRAVSYAVDRRALAKLGDGYNLDDRPTDEYLPPGLPGSSHTQIYPLTPDLAKARSLATGHGRTAVLYTCNSAACDQQAKILKSNLAAIGLRLRIKSFSHTALFAQIERPAAPFDLAAATWLPDYPDPDAMLSGMLENPSLYPTFANREYRRRLTHAAQLTGPERYLTYGGLALDLARDAAPLIAYGNSSAPEFFSARVGCQTYGFYAGADLAALCIRTSKR